MRRLHYYGLWVLVGILLFYGCKQDTTAWSDLIKDHAHTAELKAPLQDAFSLRYQRNYPAAARAFESVLKDKTIGRSTQIDVLNQLGFIYLEMGDTAAAIPLLDKLAKQESDFNAFQRADYWYNLGVLNLQRINPDEAKKNLEDALRVYIAKYPRGHLRIAMAYTQMAIYQFDFGLNTKEVNNSINAAFRSYYYVNPKDSTLYPYADKVNYLMAHYYRIVKRDYQAGLNHCRLAEELIQSSPWKNTVLQARCLVVKGMLLKKAERYYEADITLNQGLKLLIEQGKNSIFIQEVYRFLIVNAAGRLDTLNKSEQLYKKYSAALKDHLEKTGQKEIYVFTDDLKAYYSCFRLDKKANDCFTACLAILNKINPQVPGYRYYHESACNFLSELELKNENYKQALDHQLEAYKTDINPRITHRIKSWSDAVKPKYSKLVTNSFFAFRNVGKIYLSRYKERKDVKDIALAVRLFEVSDSLMSLSLTMSEGGVLSYHQEIGDETYASALEATHIAYTLANEYPQLLNKDKILDLAFRFIERQKTYILTREDLPSKDWTRFYTTKIKKAAADISKLENESSNVDNILSLVRANFEYDSLLNKLSQKASAQFKQNIQTVQNIRTGLKENEIIVQYKVFDQLTYVFGISRNTIFFDTVYSTKKLQRLVNQFFNLIRSPKVDHFDYASMNRARMVYDLLLKPVFSKISAPRNATLIIIPDRFLTVLPFDALPISLDPKVSKWVNVDYLLNKYYIVYAPSWKIWQANRYTQLSNSQYPAAFFSYTVQEYPTSKLALLGAKKEKEALANFARTTPYVGSDCTAEQFNKNAARFKILHFCLHGRSDLSKLDNNRIYFKIKKSMEDSLGGDQIASLDLKGKWAIISACETAIGQTNAEGTYSLSRAFLQAGCAFTISSLWKINTGSTSTILADFYQNLRTEKQPWKALTKAKRKFLEKENQPPYYWSGLIPTI